MVNIFVNYHSLIIPVFLTVSFQLLFSMDEESDTCRKCKARQEEDKRLEAERAEQAARDREEQRKRAANNYLSRFFRVFVNIFERK